jgi:hypothetical protein
MNRFTKTQTRTLRLIQKEQFGDNPKSKVGQRYDFWFVGGSTSYEGGWNLPLHNQFRNQYSMIHDLFGDNWKTAIDKNW